MINNPAIIVRFSRMAQSVLVLYSRHALSREAPLSMCRQGALPADGVILRMRCQWFYQSNHTIGLDWTNPCHRLGLSGWWNNCEMHATVLCRPAVPTPSVLCRFIWARTPITPLISQSYLLLVPRRSALSLYLASAEAVAHESKIRACEDLRLNRRATPAT
jgi:hypothetical protein